MKWMWRAVRPGIFGLGVSCCVGAVMVDINCALSNDNVRIESLRENIGDDNALAGLPLPGLTIRRWHSDWGLAAGEGLRVRGVFRRILDANEKSPALCCEGQLAQGRKSRPTPRYR